MVNLLELIEAFVQVGFAIATAPEKIPIVRLSMRKMIRLQQRADQFCIPCKNLI